MFCNILEENSYLQTMISILYLDIESLVIMNDLNVLFLILNEYEARLEQKFLKKRITIWQYSCFS